MKNSELIREVREEYIQNNNISSKIPEMLAILNDRLERGQLTSAEVEFLPFLLRQLREHTYETQKLNASLCCLLGKKMV